MALFFLASLSLQDVRAALYLEEGFAYPAGSSLGFVAPWAGSSDASISVVDGNLTLVPVRETTALGNLLQVREGAGGIVSRVFAPAPVADGAVYYSCLIRCAILSTDPQVLAALAGSGVALPPQPGEGLELQASEAPGGYQLAVAHSGVEAVRASQLLMFGDTHFIVMKYDFNSGQISLFINPAAGEPEPATPDAVANSPGVVASPPDLQVLMFGSPGSVSQGSWEFDTVRLGSTWEDVTPAQAALSVVGPANQSACLGGPVTFSVTAVGTPPYGYQWYAYDPWFADGFPIADATNATYTIAQPTSDDTILAYYVVVTDAREFVTSDFAALSFSTAVPEIVTPPADQVVLPGADATFSVVVVQNDGLSYQWRVNGSPIPGATDLSYTVTNTAEPVALGAYDVVVTNGCGAVTSAPPAVLRVSQSFYAAGALPAALGWMTLFTTNSAGANLFVWSSHDIGRAVTNWTLEGLMSELPLDDGSGKSRYSLNVNPAASPVYYLIGSTTAGPYQQLVPLHSITANAGANPVFSSITVAISADGILQFRAPTINLTSPANGATFVTPANITLTADATDSDGDVARVEFLSGSTVLGSDATVPFSLVWTNVLPGTYSLRARATDNSGDTTTSTAVSVVVMPPLTLPPTVNLTVPANGAAFTAPASVTLSADAADSDGTITLVEFLSGSTVISSDTAAPYTFAWNGLGPGTYSLSARATDNSGATTTSSTVLITVQPPPNTPLTVILTSPANGATFTAPASIPFVADAFVSDRKVSLVAFISGATVLGTATTPPYSFTWDHVPAGTYSVRAWATDSSGANTISPAVSITVNPAPNVPPNVSLTGPTNASAFTVPASITLTADATDSDGTITSVEFLAGTNVLGTVTTPPYRLAWTNVSTGTYSLRVRASDNSGATTTSPAVPITVGPPPNIPPWAVLTSPTNSSIFTVPANLILTADATDSDGGVTVVEFLADTNVLGTATAPPYLFAWTNVPAGSYSLRARATDNQGATTTTPAISINVELPPPNIPPTVSLASPVQGAVFAASATIPISAEVVDGDGTITLVEFLAGNTVIGSDATPPFAIAWGGMSPGTHSLSVRATDNSGATTISPAVLVTVNPLPNTPLTAILTGPTNGATFAAPASIALTANAFVSDGTVSLVAFVSGSTVLGTATTPPYSFTWDYVPAGTYSVRAWATDSRGGNTISPAISVTVHPSPNAPPTVNLTGPTNATAFTSPASLSLSADATDSDGAVTQVEFLADTNVIGAATTPPYRLAWTNVPVGTHSLRARATDNSGATTTSPAVSITVSPPPNVPPTVALAEPTNDVPFISPATVLLSADAGDGDGAVIRVEFLANTNVLGTATAPPYLFVWTNVLAGTYSLRARATDNTGDSTTSSAVLLTVQPPPNVPPTVSLTVPANGAAFTAPASIALTADAADSDGAVTLVEFLSGSTLLGTVTAPPYSLVWNHAPPGDYSLRARVTDNRGATTTSAAVLITVNPAPIVPLTVNLTGPTNDATFTAPARITFTADAFVSDGTVNLVAFVSGSTVLGTAATPPYSFTWDDVPAGTYSVRAWATDDHGATTTSPAVSITVHPPPNIPPTVTLTGPTNGDPFITPATILLSAEAGDSDGTIARVEFLVDTNVLGIATMPPYHFAWTNVPAGTHSLNARVTDDRGATTTSPAISITVNPPPNVPPTVSLTNPTNSDTFAAPAGDISATPAAAPFTAPVSITLTAEAADSDGTITLVEFLSDTNVLGNATAHPYSFAWDQVPAGIYSLRARATDDRGATTTSSAVSITVHPPPNVPPTVSLTGPTSSGSFVAPASIPLSADAADSDGTVTLVEFLSGTNVLGSVAMPPYHFAWTNLPAGIYSLSARATDDSGDTTTSPVVLVTVSAPPAIGQQPTPRTVLLGKNVDFKVSAAGTKPLSYQWYFGTDTPIADATNSTLTLLGVKDADAGGYSVAISSPFGSVTSRIASLTVLPPPQLTVHRGTVGFEFSGFGVPGESYWVQAATNLDEPVAWVTVATNVAGVDGLVRCTDTNAPVSPARFFRLLSP